MFAAAFLLRGMRSALGRVGALAHRVASDHFEELGRPDELFHGGFGLLSVGNLRKPRYWALALLDRLGDQELAVDIAGDGAWGLVEALAARGDDGRISVLAWNFTFDQGAPRDRQLPMTPQASGPPRYRSAMSGPRTTTGDVVPPTRAFAQASWTPGTTSGSSAVLTGPKKPSAQP